MRNYFHFKHEARISDGLHTSYQESLLFCTLCPELVCPSEVTASS